MWVNGEYDPWTPATVSSKSRPGGPLKSSKQAPVWIVSNTNYDGIFTSYNGIFTNYDGIFTNYDGIFTNYDGIFTSYNGIFTNEDGIFTRQDGISIHYEGVSIRHILYPITYNVVHTRYPL
ncbi:hypothetical protein J3458_021453 [Metarhizium acridum]|uniref:uncharacterized protein n=1 Tax=Metarhizium acridum TaxID=92637 RepID=UPI001C6C41DA|nr:hypothetical protein J3458_021453 [Metarhizium acridum]